MNRRPDWGAQLQRIVRTYSRRPFSWADAHCGLFVADAVAAMTGVDPIARYRDLGSLRAAVVALRADGFQDQTALVASLFPEIPLSAARPGDVIAYGRRSLGVLQVPHIYAMAPAGLALVHVSHAKKAFRI